MTKADLVEIVAREADMTKKDVEQLVEIIFDSIVMRQPVSFDKINCDGELNSRLSKTVLVS